MRRVSRSERTRDYRSQRVERAVRNMDKRNYKRASMSKANKITLMMIVFFVLFGFILSTRYAKTTKFTFDKDFFLEKYQYTIQEKKSIFKYDKSLIDIVRNKDEYTFLQNSSRETNNLIALKQKNGKVSEVAVIGKVRYTKNFEQSYLENMRIILSIVLDVNYDNTQELLKNMKILNEENEIIYRKKIVKINYYGFDITFSKINGNLIFNIQSK